MLRNLIYLNLVVCFINSVTTKWIPLSTDTRSSGYRKINSAFRVRINSPKKYIFDSDGNFVHGSDEQEIRSNRVTDHAVQIFKSRSYLQNQQDFTSLNDGDAKTNLDHNFLKRKRRSLSRSEDRSEKASEKTGGKSRQKKSLFKKDGSSFKTKGRRGKRSNIRYIDLTGGWIPKFNNDSKSGKKINPEVSGKHTNGGVKYTATSGGYEGQVKSGYSKASGALKTGVAAYAGKKGAYLKVVAPSGKVSSYGVGVGANLSINAEATVNDGEVKFGVEGPSVNAHVGPFGGGIGVGFGAEVSANFKKGAGGKVATPVGSFGVKAGCITEVCVFVCVTAKMC